MCGFVALVRHPGISADSGRAAVVAASSVIEHRGPDDSGVEARGNVCFAFRRLAILDLSPSGHQPMQSIDGRYLMVFNGEIYNYLELRSELGALGHRFQSSGDSEVLLHAFMEWGPAALSKLRGMFALCIHDSRDNSVIAARDRFGIKPLYLLKGRHGALFASELKCIRASGLWAGAINERQIATTLSYGRSDVTPDSSETFLLDVEPVAAAHYVRVTGGGEISTHRYWDPAGIARTGSSDVAAFKATFDESISLHLRADVPVGVMLSGGMDSTAIACSMVQAVHEAGDDVTLHAFSYESEKFDESEQIADTVKATGAVRHVLRDADAQTIWEQLRRTIWHHDELVHSPTVLVGFQLYELAARTGIRVVLNGQGADETLAGYPYFAEHVLLERDRELKGRDRELEFKGAADMLGCSVQTLEGRVATLRKADFKSRLPLYAALTAGRRMHDSGAHRYLRQEFAAQAKPSRPSIVGESFSAAILRAITSGPLPQYLRVEDRNSMAHSIESRVPFLDHVLVEHALSLPAASLMSQGWNKRILREAMQGRIPDSVRERRAKLGFPTAARDWFAGPLATFFREIVAGSPAQRSGWFDMAAIAKALDEHIALQRDNSGILFSFAQSNTWLELHESGWKA